jgi:hypothetical protein
MWAAIPLEIEAQHRGEEVGVFTLSSAREMIAGAVSVGLVFRRPVIKRPCFPARSDVRLTGRGQRMFCLRLFFL